jgi:hypothetical protein
LDNPSLLLKRMKLRLHFHPTFSAGQPCDPFPPRDPRIDTLLCGRPRPHPAACRPIPSSSLRDAAARALSPLPSTPPPHPRSHLAASAISPPWPHRLRGQIHHCRLPHRSRDSVPPLPIDLATPSPLPRIDLDSIPSPRSMSPRPIFVPPPPDRRSPGPISPTADSVATVRLPPASHVLAPLPLVRSRVP